jgi:hypothetical protein
MGKTEFGGEKYFAYRFLAYGENSRVVPNGRSWLPGTKCIGTEGGSVKIERNRVWYSSYLLISTS